MQVGHGHTKRPSPACGVALRFARFRLLPILLTLSLIGALAFVPVDFRIREVQLNNVKSPLLEIHRNEAYAIPAAIPAAGAALAALAAELGISETALVAGICAIGVGATGLAIYNSDWTDLDNPPAPGWPAWNDLPPAVQDGYDYNDEPRAKNYHENAVAWWALQYGVIQEDGNGGFEPTPEPENNPGSWQKARNVLIALATGAGGVALNDVLGPLVDNAASSVKDLLFGNGAGELGISYNKTLNIQNVPVVMKYLDVSGHFVDGDRIRNLNSTNWVCDYVFNGQRRISFDYTESIHDFKFTKAYYNGVNQWSGENYPNVAGEFNFTVLNVSSSGSMSVQSWGTTGANAYTPYNSFSISNPSTLNALYRGTYYFPGDIVYTNGEFVSGNPDVSIDYGQMLDTPDELSESVVNNYNNYVSNYVTSGVPEGYKRAIAIPEWLLNGTTNDNPSYDDFVNVLPDEDITPIPDDNPLPGPGPGPNPPTQYQQDFGEQVGRLLAQPFTQLFPFCLITDLYDLTQVIEGSLYTNDGLRTQSNTNGTDVLVIPLDDFGIEGMENIELDLTDIRSFGLLIRPWTTALFITALLVGSFRFFLNRGGE